MNSLLYTQTASRYLRTREQYLRKNYHTLRYISQQLLHIETWLIRELGKAESLIAPVAETSVSEVLAVNCRLRTGPSSGNILCFDQIPLRPNVFIHYLADIYTEGPRESQPDLAFRDGSDSLIVTYDTSKLFPPLTAISFEFIVHQETD